MIFYEKQTIYHNSWNAAALKDREISFRQRENKPRKRARERERDGVEDNDENLLH